MSVEEAFTSEEIELTHAPVEVAPQPSRNILLITLRQRAALSELDDEKLMRFQMAFNVLVNLVTEGAA